MPDAGRSGLEAAREANSGAIRREARGEAQGANRCSEGQNLPGQLGVSGIETPVATGYLLLRPGFRLQPQGGSGGRPTIPSTLRLRARRWNSLTEASVFGPKIPSTTRPAPCSLRRR